mmetsp:Transcript_26425/g.56787  ORF Transcript_26425/g.56787 Transcript_26425/m.56787 type:complete len:252 (-) Transcript_26425:64-819(-)
MSDETTLAKLWELGTMNYEACCGAIALKQYFEMIGKKAHESFGIGKCCSGNDDIMTDAIPNSDKKCCSSQTSNQITVESSNDHLGGDGMSLLTSTSENNVPCSYITIARMCIQQVETRLMDHLLGYLQSCTLVCIVQDIGKMKVTSHSDSNDGVQQDQQPQLLVKDECNLQRIPIVCFVHATIPSCEIVKHCRDHGVVCRACKFLSTDRLWGELGMEDNNGGVVRFSLAHYNTLQETDASIQILEMMDGWF